MQLLRLIGMVITLGLFLIGMKITELIEKGGEKHASAMPEVQVTGKGKRNHQNDNH